MHLVGRKVQGCAVKPHESSVRSVSVSRLSQSSDAIALLVDHASRGAACVWIRNAVDDAIEAAGELRRCGVEVDLLHARFAMVDRLRHEQALMGRYGRAGNGRSGRVVVATQVVEASLDLDFDVMVSDLAPIGSLIQRAGRLWRHMDIRPEKDRPVPGPELHVLSPDPDMVEGEDWLSAVLGGGSWVYRLDEQWRTARALFDAGEIIAPEGLRALIEAVHGEFGPPVPETLLEAQLKAEGQARAQIGLALGNVVEAAAGYLEGTRGAVGSDALFPTRLGDPQVTLVLAHRCDGGLIPWADVDDPAVAWALSEVSVSQRRFSSLVPDQETPEIRDVKQAWPDWRREVCQVCEVRDEDGAIGGALVYDTMYGLIVRSSPERR